VLVGAAVEILILLILIGMFFQKVLSMYLSLAPQWI
jgi:hypothetical protein